MAYCFPLLDDAEILICLEELQIAFSKRLLLYPDYQAVQKMYEEFVSLFYDLPRNKIVSYSFDGLESVDKKLYTKAVKVLVLAQLLTKIMVASGVQDFGLQDIFKPSYQRTRRNVSAIINLGKYREEKVVVFVKYSEKINKAMQEVDALRMNFCNLLIEVVAFKKDGDNIEAYTIERLEKQIEYLLNHFQFLDCIFEVQSRGERQTTLQHYGLNQRNSTNIKKNSHLTHKLVNSQILPIHTVFELSRRQKYYNANRKNFREIINIFKKKKDNLVKWTKISTKIAKSIHWANAIYVILKRTSYMTERVNSEMMGLNFKMIKTKNDLVASVSENNFLKRYKFILQTKIKRIEKKIEEISSATVSCNEHLQRLSKSRVIDQSYEEWINRFDIRVVKYILKQICIQGVQNNQDWRNLISEYYRFRAQATKHIFLLTKIVAIQNISNC